IFALTAVLEGAGMEVVAAVNGREAVTTLEKDGAVDIVLMDMMMPVMDGYEAIRALRADPRLASLPVFALTAKAMRGDRDRCLEAGADEYLTKPVDSGRLLSTMRAWLGRTTR
ncbi:MAG: response regulator, partial [Myxococcales bacterium]|nr:response regulator [Myxococcales bacterium]